MYLSHVWKDRKTFNNIPVHSRARSTNYRTRQQVERENNGSYIFCWYNKKNPPLMLCSTLRGMITKGYELGSSWIPQIYQESRKFHAVFVCGGGEGRSRNFAHVFYEPLSNPLTNGVCMFFARYLVVYFVGDICVLRYPKFLSKKKTHTHTPFVHGSTGAPVDHVCKESGSIPKKTVSTFGIFLRKPQLA